jgi:integrase/recombinase XerD
MRVQRVCDGATESWTVVRADYSVVEPVELFLAHLTALDRSPNTTSAYAFDLRDFFRFLDGRGTAWEAVTAEDLALFAGWLRLPPDADSGTVIALPASTSRRAATTIRRKLAAVSSFYDFHQRRGVAVSPSLTVSRSNWFSGNRWDPFLPHLRPRQVFAARRSRSRSTSGSRRI